MIVIAGPAGAIVNQCDNSMNPANSGNSSGLIISCTFTSVAAAGTSLEVQDYKDAVWHAGAVRQVSVKISRADGNTFGHYIVRWTGTNSNNEQGPVASDVNHSIENTTSTLYTINGNNGNQTDHTPLGSVIDAGTTVRSVVAGVGGYWVLSKPTVEGRDFGKPGCTASGGGTCDQSVAFGISISNNIGREGNNGDTTAGSGTVASVFTPPTGCSTTLGGGTAADCTGPGTGNTSASQGMNFTSTDLGSFLSGGDLPDGAQISVINTTQSVTLACTSAGVAGTPAWNWGSGATCSGGFGAVTNEASPLVLTITPYPIPTGNRFMSGVTIADTSPTGTGTTPAGTRTISTSGASFSNFDIGLKILGCQLPAGAPAGSICSSATVVPSGVRIASVGGGGTSAVTTAGTGSPAWSQSGLVNATGQHLTIGVASKTAPSTGGVVGFLAISLEVDPSVSPTAPPCAAHKVSGFQLPIKWRNPAASPTGTTNPPSGYQGFSGPGYDFGNVGLPVNQYAGFSHNGVSTAQLTVLTSVTTFAGFVHQDLTVAGGVPTTTRWRIVFEFLPVAIGLCTSAGITGIAETLNIMGLESKHAMNPSGTGGAFGATRALLPELQGRLTTYTGSAGINAGAHVIAGTPAPTENNTCKISSPNIIGVGCQP